MSDRNAQHAAGAGTEMMGLGLGRIGELAGLLNEPEAAAGGSGPLALALDRIDEDPNQPRTRSNPGFSKASLEELAGTIRARGVKTPISVRERQDAPGRFVINHGARRYRASQMAGRETIPAFIDNDYNQADQIVENLQRNALTPREIADYIGREMAKGVKKGDIATAIGKSGAFVSQHVTLLDLPEPIADVFHSGRASDVTVVNELVKAYNKNPEAVVAWLRDDEQELTRGATKLLREYLDDKRKHEEDDARGGDEETAEHPEAAVKTKAPKEPNPGKLKRAIVQVKHNNRLARLILKRRPSTEGCAWLMYDDDGSELETALTQVQLVAIREG